MGRLGFSSNGATSGAAVSRGVLPFEFFAYISAPFSTNNLTSLKCPFAAASCKGVSLSSPFAFTLAPAWTRRNATSYQPWLQASCKGVQPAIKQTLIVLKWIERV